VRGRFIEKDFQVKIIETEIEDRKEQSGKYRREVSK